MTTTTTPVFNIPATLAKPSKAKSKGANKLTLPGFEDIAQRVKDRARQIESLEAEQALETVDLIEEARALRVAEECEGNFAKTVEVPCLDGDKPVQVVFSDRYKQIDPEHEPLLRAVLGERFTGTMKLAATAKPRGDLTVEKLQAVLGDKYAAFCTLFEVSEHYTPCASFMEVRSHLRPTLAPAVNKALDEIVDLTQFKPSIKTK